MASASRILRDATTGKEVEVIISKAGKLFQVEGFSRDFVKKARKAALLWISRDKCDS